MSARPRVIATEAEPLRLVVVGAGGMGKAWLQAIADDPRTTVVGLVDLDRDRARTARGGRTDVVIGTDLAAVLDESAAQAVVNVTVPEAHHAVNVVALERGLPVLSEKPAAPDVATALRSAAVAARADRLLMISQSRRYLAAYDRLRALVDGLGSLALVRVELLKAPRFGGFREEMQHAFLVDMAIHAFDAVRHLIGESPVAVTCTEWNPTFSWFAHGSTAEAVFDFPSGVRFGFTGSWVASGFETSWNGSWRVMGERGTVLWDGESAPVRQLAGLEPELPEPLPVTPHEIAGALVEFTDALGTGVTPTGWIDENIGSLAMVEAAVLSAADQRRVSFAEVYDRAKDQALRAETDEALAGWISAWQPPASPTP